MRLGTTAIASGSANGTYFGINGASSADFLNFQVSGSYKLKVTSTGLVDSATGFAVAGTAGQTQDCSGTGYFLQNPVIKGGIITGGTCATGGGGGSGVASVNSATGALTLQGTSNQITVGTVGGTITLSTPQDINQAADVTFGSLTVGVAGVGNDYITLDTTAGFQAYGAARHTKRITLTPEYSGAVFHSPGSNDVGYMTSDYNSSHNYYEWTTDQATAQVYDIVVRYQLPSDFDGFATGTFKLWDYASNSNNAVSYKILDNSGTDCYGGFQTAAVSYGSWNPATLTDPTTGGCSFGANDVITIMIEPSANTAVTNLTRVGEFQFDYKSKF
jgi:hypothetical protein